MKNNGGLIVFAGLFLALVVVAFSLGSYDPITPAVPQAQAALVVGAQASSWLGAGMNWIVGLMIGAIFTGIGMSMFGEALKAYKLWKRQAGAGRWQAGPNAQWQGQSQGPKLTKQDMLLLALSGRLPTGAGASRPYAEPARDDDDDLNIEM